MKENLSNKEVSLIQAMCFYMLDVDGFTNEAKKVLQNLHDRYACDYRVESLKV